MVVEWSDTSWFRRVQRRGVANVDVILVSFDDECHRQRRAQRDVDEPLHGCGLGSSAMTEDVVDRGVIGVGSIPMSGIPKVVRVEGVGHGWDREFQAVAERTGLRTTICTTVHVLESKSFECRDCEVVAFVRFAFQWFVQWLIVARSCAGPGSQLELVRASRLRHGGLIL